MEDQIKELMGLVDDMREIGWEMRGADDWGADLSDDFAKAARLNAVIESKLRAMLERKPLTAIEYNQIPALCLIEPSKYEAVVRGVEREHGIGIGGE